MGIPLNSSVSYICVLKTQYKVITFAAVASKPNFAVEILGADRNNIEASNKNSQEIFPRFTLLKYSNFPIQSI